MSVDFKTFVSLAPSVSAARLPVLLRGRHGIGKSQVVYQLAAAAGLPVVERRASQMTEGDLVGLPSVEANRTSFNPPDWFNRLVKSRWSCSLMRWTELPWKFAKESLS